MQNKKNVSLKTQHAQSQEHVLFCGTRFILMAKEKHGGKKKNTKRKT